MSNAPRIYVRGSYIDIHGNQNVYLSVDKDGEVKTHIDEWQLKQPAPAPSESALPEVLLTPEAKSLHAKLCQAGLLDGQWQPIGLSNAEKGTLIEYIADELDIRAKWKFFGDCWQVNSGTLRTAYNQALNQRKSLNFQDRLKAVMA